jgi:group I intron endonuclease
MSNIEKIPGVYLIQSMSHPNRIYVGSANNLYRRKYVHFASLRAHNHDNSKLQRHYDKYGEADLVFEIIETGAYLDKQHLLAREQGWMYHFAYKNTYLPYFNVRPIAESNLGIKRTIEQREACRTRRIGKKNSEESKIKNSIAHKGKNFNPPQTPEQRKRSSERAILRQTGHHLSQETKDKISATLMGHQ